MATTNIFDKAKKAEPKKEETHEIVSIPEIERHLEQIAGINVKLAELEAEKALLDSEIRDAGKEAMVDLYNKKKTFPGTLKIVAGKMSFQFITSDRYKMVDRERFDVLAALYGRGIVDEENVYSFNTAILTKHMDHISEILMSSPKLTAEEKENLLNCETVLSVKKGTIKNLFALDNVENVGSVVDDIQPVFSVKSVQKIV